MFELQHVLRRLRRRPGTPVFAAFTLALGVAATVSVYLIVRDVLLRDLPHADPDRLVLVWRETARDPGLRGALSPGDWLDVREGVEAFSAVAAVNSFSATLVTDGGVPEQLVLGVVTGDFFETIGFRPALGRGIGPADDGPRSGPDDVRPLVLDHRFWRDRFGGDATALGRSVRLGGSPYTVVGVLPPEDRLYLPRGSGMTADVQGWIPFDVAYRGQPRDGAYLRVLARLASGAGLERADQELASLAARLRAAHPEHAESGFDLRAEPLHREVTAHVRPILTVLGLAAAAVLLVTFANVATLLLVRFTSRRVETAVRTALGAGRVRQLRTLVLESGLVCFGGTLLGLLLAGPAVAGLVALEPGVVPRAAEIALDRSVVGPALVLAFLATLVCGLGPAWITTPDEVAGLLRSRGSGERGAARWLRRVLLALQVVTSFALIYGGSSLVGTLVRVRTADLGFDPEGVLTARVTLPFGSYRDTDEWVAFFGALEERLVGAPGVAAAGVTSDLPTRGDQSLEPWAPVDAGATETWGARTALHRMVSPGYFAAAGIAVSAGRGFLTTDTRTDPPVAVVDRTLAEALARDGGAVVGRRIDVTRHEFDDGYSVTRGRVEVVGVVNDVPHDHPEATPPGTIYMPLAQYPLWAQSVVVRGRAGIPPTAEVVRNAVAALDAALPVTNVRTLEDVTAETMATTRFLLALVAGLAAVVVGLTAAGLFGLVGQTVLQRRRELGVRMALGAREARVVWMVILAGLGVVGAGLVPGLALVPLVGRTLRDALGQGPAVDPVAAIAAAVAVAGVAVVACGVPALRAARIRPAATLREE